MKNVVAMILGGGRGKRLLPLTEHRCKPAVPVGGKYRLVDVPISNCINSDIRQIFVLTQYRSASLNRHVAQTYSFDSFTDGFVDVLAAEQTLENANWFQGAADAVRQNLEVLDNYPCEDVLIVNGDILFRLDLRKAVDYHRSRGGDVTVLAAPVGSDCADKFGFTKVDRHTQVVHYLEKPGPERIGELPADPEIMRRFSIQTNGDCYLASMGVYVFRKEALRRLLSEEPCVDFGSDILPRALCDGKVFAFLFGEYWRDLGTIRDFYDGNLDLGRDRPSFSFYDANSPIYTRPRFLPPSNLLDCQVRNSLIGEGCLIGKSEITDSVIGMRTIIREGATIERSVVMGADLYDEFPIYCDEPDESRLGIGPGSLIRGAIVDKNARIGKNCRIANDSSVRETDQELYAIRDRIVIIRKNAKIPDGTEI